MTTTIFTKEHDEALKDMERRAHSAGLSSSTLTVLNSIIARLRNKLCENRTPKQLTNDIDVFVAAVNRYLIRHVLMRPTFNRSLMRPTFNRSVACIDNDLKLPDSSDIELPKLRAAVFGRRDAVVGRSRRRLVFR